MQTTQPVASRFYSSVPDKHMISSIAFFKSTGTGPSNIADFMLAQAGRAVIAEHGYYCLVVRGLLLKLCDVGILSDILARIAHTLPDYK
jgi:hypothetical protein